MEKKRIALVLVIIAIMLNLFWFFGYNYQVVTSGKTFFNLNNFIFEATSAIGRVLITIGQPASQLIIFSPENITYNFSIENLTYPINLNVSSDAIITAWWYFLYDVTHSEYSKIGVSFVPNSSINAVKWGNNLTVFGRDNNDNILTNSTYFYVSVPNSAPFIFNISTQQYACENTVFSKYFLVGDLDENLETVDITPKNPFYFSLSNVVNYTHNKYELFSRNLTKADVKNYSETISASDGEYSDSKQVNISVIGINNLPVLSTIGVQTIWTHGDNSTFNKTVNVLDTESGNETSGNINFSLDFLGSENLFNISQNGSMYFEANGSNAGVYNLSLCASDKALSFIHPNISLCNQTGLSNTVCENFSLTITDENRPPTIIDWYPESLSINSTQALSGNNFYFNISAYDPDGTITDIYWLVDNAVTEYVPGQLSDNFSYDFLCGSSSLHVVKAIVTDGELNDSITWLVLTSSISCTDTTPSSGGGGGGGCSSKWVCGEWNICQSLQVSLESGYLQGSDFRKVKDSCDALSYSEQICGFQMRDCRDLLGCNDSSTRPSLFGACYYVKDPGCRDGVKNCHDGACETLIDCGGPCVPCPTCSDRIKNQGEVGIDCGGPCPWACMELRTKCSLPFCMSYLLLLFILVCLILLVLIIIKVFKLYLLNKKIKEIEKKK